LGEAGGMERSEHVCVGGAGLPHLDGTGLRGAVHQRFLRVAAA
jgi:hypothetical protein